MRKPPRREKCAEPSCSVILTYTGKGRPRTFCPMHCPHPERDLQRAEDARADELDAGDVDALERKSARHQAQRLGGQAIEVAADAWRSRMLAVGLGWDSRPEVAAALAGVVIRDAEDLASLVVEAQRFSDLKDRKAQAVGAILHGAVALGAMQLAASIPAIAPTQRANAVKAMTAALHAVQGHGQPAYSELRLVVRSPEGLEYEWATHQATGSPASSTTTTIETSGDTEQLKH